MRAVLFDLDYTLFETSEQLHEGVKELLVIIKRLGFKIGALTSDDYRVLVRLEEAGIRHFFDAVLCADHIDTPKAVHGIHRILKDLETKAEHTIFVSHAHSDILLGKDAGLRKTVGVAHDFEHSKTLSNAEPDHIVHDVPGVLDVLG